MCEESNFDGKRGSPPTTGTRSDVTPRRVIKGHTNTATFEDDVLILHAHFEVFLPSSSACYLPNEPLGMPGPQP